MSQILFLCFILSNALVGLAMASHKPQIMVQSAPSPSPSPSNSQRLYKAEAPVIRKLGKHQHEEVVIGSSATPSLSPSKASHSGEEHKQNSIDEPNTEEILSSQGHLIKHHHHSMFDKSVAGGGVILGGLATTFLVAVFCYIRATGRHQAEANV
ncbi:Transforming growth factor beta receptor type 3 [Quillaja saponaria]|uniref:Transforming growth factor beta receptor type 3 n=1 Tax=Quillaja saponaria TaxID=32244 RepID=A0AAD7L2W7_QUISA|nr:Transforming growth factor beta receptor type 3 [Quillaja saponaria]